MKLFANHIHEPVMVRAEITPVPAEPTPEERLGDGACGEIGCGATTGVGCEYVDRRSRPCPTAMCPQHRSVVHGGIYCGVHGDTVRATDWEFATGYHPDLDNRVPLLVATAARALEDDVVAMLHRVCTELGESLLSDTVRFVLVGVDRVRTWERSWKTASPIGVGCRVALCVEERRRDVLIIRVNSKPVLEIAAPWGAIGAAADDVRLQALVDQVLMPVGRVVHSWMEAQLAEIARQQESAGDRWRGGS